MVGQEDEVDPEQRRVPERDRRDRPDQRTSQASLARSERPALPTPLHRHPVVDGPEDAQLTSTNSGSRIERPTVE